MGPALSGLLRNAVGSLAVLATVAAIAFGFPLLDMSLPAVRAVGTDVAYQVGAGVTMVPPPGTNVDLTRTRPSGDRGTALFMVGGVRIAVVAKPYRGTLDEAAGRLCDKISNTAGFQVTGSRRTIQTAQGVAGVGGAYRSPGRLGEYAVFVAEDVSVEVTASGPEQQLQSLLGPLEASLASVAFGAGE